MESLGCFEGGGPPPPPPPPPRVPITITNTIMVLVYCFLPGIIHDEKKKKNISYKDM